MYFSAARTCFPGPQVVERSQPAAWAEEFGAQEGRHHAAGPSHPAGWASEFERQHAQAEAGTSKGDWADEFARGMGALNLGEDRELAAAWDEAKGWAEEFSKGDEETWKVGVHKVWRLGGAGGA